MIDPELRRSIVELEMVRSIDIHPDGRVDVVVSLTTPGCPIRAQFERAVVDNVGTVEGVTSVGVGFDVLSDTEKQGLQQKLGRPGGLPEGALAKVKNVICVASGKGGVGKSTMTANLAAALTAEGKRAGALDCDVYGYSIPRMLGVNSRPEVNAERKIMPLDSPSGVKVMSIGFFVEENAAVVWRGPMLHKAIQQFLEDVDWGELDYLLLDLPPGTGDVSMTLAQLLPQARILVVTTPQPAAQTVAARAAEMAAKVDLEMLGVIENMSGLHRSRRAALHDLRRGRRPGARRRARACRCSARCRSRRRSASTPTPATRSWSPSPTRRLDRDPPGGARDHRRNPGRAAADAGGRRRHAGRAGAARRHRAAGRPGRRLSRGPPLGPGLGDPAPRRPSIAAARAIVAIRPATTIAPAESRKPAPVLVHGMPR